MRSIKDVVIVWDLDSDNVRVLDSEVYAKKKRDWKFSWGACNREVWDEKVGSDKLTIMVLAFAIELIVFYGCSKDAVNEAFSQIKEYDKVIPIGLNTFQRRY